MPELQLVTASELAVKAAGFEPRAEGPIPHDDRCVWCARELPKGTPVTRWRPTPKFNDHDKLAARGSRYLCQWCTVVSGPKFVTALSTAVFCADGVFPFHSNIHRGYWLLNPPEPPFLMCAKTTATSQHTIWSTPVSYSRDMYYVRVAHNVIRIRRPALNALIEAVTAEAQRLDVPYYRLFHSLDRHMATPGFGAISDWYASGSAPEPLSSQFTEIVAAATPGELWALGMIKSDKYKPLDARPEPLHTAP